MIWTRGFCGTATVGNSGLRLCRCAAVCQPSRRRYTARDAEPSSESLEVDAAEAGRRLDVFLAERLALSRGARAAPARERRGAGRRAAGRRGRQGPRAARGRARRGGAAARADAERVAAEPDAPLRVLAHGPGWLVVDKPAGVPVHPLVAGERGTLLGAVAARHPEIQGVGEGGLRSGVVHRLDVDTSGALLLATTPRSGSGCAPRFASTASTKRYRAIALGPRRGGRRDRAAARDRAPPARVRARRAPAGASARGARRTHHALARARARCADATLLEVRTVTGFLHQVRATLAHLGHPLAGDRTYAPDGDATGAARHMLHAAALALRGDPRGEPRSARLRRAARVALRGG